MTNLPPPQDGMHSEAPTHSHDKAPDNSGGWIAELSLEYALSHDKTRLLRKAFNGPLTVQKPFYPEDKVCHTYLIHPPGGIVGGDQLFLDVKIGPQAHTLITTPGANKFYRSAGPYAELNQAFRLADNSALEFLPQETILFDASLSHINSEISIQKSSRLMLWDIVCLGRPASNSFFQHGRCVQQLQVSCDNQPYLSDRSEFDALSENMNAPWGLDGFTCSAYMLAYPVNEAMLADISSLALCEQQQRLSLSLIRDMLVCRYLGYHAQNAKAELEKIWRRLRPAIMMRPASAPRIWNT